MEAISPTGPEAPGDQMDDRKAVKDDLLMKITKVDREIAKTESQIAKLKKKYVSLYYVLITQESFNFKETLLLL